MAESCEFATFFPLCSGTHSRGTKDLLQLSDFKVVIHGTKNHLLRTTKQKNLPSGQSENATNSLWVNRFENGSFNNFFLINLYQANESNTVRKNNDLKYHEQEVARNALSKWSKTPTNRENEKKNKVGDGEVEVLSCSYCHI